MILYQDCSSHLDSSKNMAARGRGLFSLFIEKCKNHLVPNHWTDFRIILQKCSFGDPLPRLFKSFGFVKKTWPPGGRAYFPYICIFIENFKNVLVRNQWTDFNITWKDVFVTLFQGCSSHHDSSKNMAARGWGLFSLYIYIENLKENLLVRNHWTDFSITWQKCFLGDPLLSLFRPS